MIEINAKEPEILDKETILKGKKIANGLISRFKEYKSKADNATYILKQNRIDINDNDTYVEKGFFAFLADLLQIKKMNLDSDNLISELWKNEKLSRESLANHLKEELNKYSNLEKEVLKEKGLENVNFEKIAKNLENEKIINLTSQILENKIKDFKKENPNIENIANIENDSKIKEIKPNDVIKAFNSSNEKELTKEKINIAKNIITKR
ncbi:hypothetical protein QTF06_001519 [Campylobacter jejuni]|nr:hypothetical protein [Campylobacter jejuni]EJP2870369.1 hypothetical protein [Campylobacter jejuni]ELQ2083963.1 hypothetical protein [Campylobacter jejuni]ELQ2098241.1 hypothetical protein [Campylobacter jejuni]